MIVSKRHRTWMSLDFKKGVDDHVLSLCAIGLYCLQITKRVRTTMFYHYVPSNLIGSGYQNGCGWPCLSPHAIGLDCLWIAKKVQMTMFCLCVPFDLIVSWYHKRSKWPCFVCAYHQTWLSLDGKEGADDHALSSCGIRLDCLWITKKVSMTMFCLHVPSGLIVSRLQKGEWPCFVSACHQTWLSLDRKKASDDNALSPRAIGLNCLWIAKRVRLTMFCLHVPSD